MPRECFGVDTGRKPKAGHEAWILICHLPVLMHCLCTQRVHCAIFIEDSAMLFEAAAYGSQYQGTSTLLAITVTM